VRREDHGDARGGTLLEHTGHDVDRERVETREGLVEDEHLRVVHQRRGDLRALLVAERERLDVVFESLAEAQLLEQDGGARGRVGLGEAVEPRQVDDVLEHLHLGVQPALLGHVAEAAAIGRRDLGAVERDDAGVLRENAQHDPHGGGLSCAVASDEAGETAGPHVERHVVEHAPPSVALGDPRQLQHAAPPVVGLIVRSTLRTAAGGCLPPRRGIALRRAGEVRSMAGGSVFQEYCMRRNRS
jgi:hypothetical protein